LEAGGDDDEDGEGDRDGEGSDDQGLSGLNATLGLVIHAMADGIALGASSLSSSGGLGFVVFLAVIVHKGESQRGQIPAG
jgi:zinc transporter 9